MPVGVAAFDTEGKTSWLNPEAERLFAIASEAGLDLTAAEPGLVEFSHLSVHVNRVSMPENGSLLVIEDRSQLVDLERQVHRLDRLAGLSELALGVAHEIKNPLNGVVGFASLMERSKDPETMQRYAGKIRGGLQQVDEIVKAMLDFAQPESKSAAMAQLGTIITEAAALAEIGRDCLITAGDLHVEAQSFALVRVLTNLFRNSTEAATGPTAKIHAEVQDLGDELLITVCDEGPGISSELGNKIFEPFVSTKERGHGLGLALSCRVLSFLGGSVELIQLDPPGACFEVRIPQRSSTIIPRPEALKFRSDD
jgi:signal transduction histidine kinase